MANSNGPTYTFKAKVWIFGGEASWYFVTLPAKYADEIKMLSPPHKKGFGSLKVTAKIKDVSWETSIFPDSPSKSYVLPIKKAIRTQLGIDAPNEVTTSVTLKNLI